MPRKVYGTYSTNYSGPIKEMDVKLDIESFDQNDPPSKMRGAFRGTQELELPKGDFSFKVHPLHKFYYSGRMTGVKSEFEVTKTDSSGGEI